MFLKVLVKQQVCFLSEEHIHIAPTTESFSSNTIFRGKQSDDIIGVAG